MALAYLAAVTTRVTLGTEVLVLPQRQPTLVAKQVSTLDTLSGGRMRLGVGVGWQESEYEALGEELPDPRRAHGRGDPAAARLLERRAGDFAGPHYRAVAMAMEPKPPQGGALPIWIGGNSEAALPPRRPPRRRLAGEPRDRTPTTPGAPSTSIHRHAEEAGRDPAAIGLQSMVAPPPRDAGGQDVSTRTTTRVVARVARSPAMGFGWIALNATAIFQAGARTVDAIIDELARLHDKIRAEIG